MPAAGSSSMVLHAIMQLNQSVLEALDGLQLQGYVTVTSRDQWDAVADEQRYDTDDELVDRLLVEKGRDEVAAAHQPDVLAGLLSKSAYVGPDRIVHELHARRDIGWRPMTREDDARTLRVELRT